MNDSASPRAASLLEPDEPAPAWVENARSDSPYLLICDHAGNRIPHRLAHLGLAERELARHIAWDIGIAGVGRQLSRRLSATCIGQTYSRLVIDCNRKPGAPESVVEFSDGTPVPGNVGLPAQAIAQREDEIFAPYHARIAQELDARARRGLATHLILLHSFTPIYRGHVRPWHAGVLYARDTRLAQALLATMRADPALVIGDNEPYSAADESDFALNHYGVARRLLHVELEIRQDLIAEAAGQREWAERLAAWLPVALRAADSVGRP